MCIAEFGCSGRASSLCASMTGAFVVDAEQTARNSALRIEAAIEGAIVAVLQIGEFGAIRPASVSFGIRNNVVVMVGRNAMS